MDKVEALIKKLKEIKEELSKNVNMSYSGAPNMTKDEMNKKPDIVRPDAGYGKVTVKDTNPQPDPKKPNAYGKVIMKDDEPHKDDPDHEKKEKKIASKIKEEAKDLADMHKEELTCSENGQWSLEKGSYHGRRMGGKHGGFASSKTGRANKTIAGGKEYSSAPFGSTKQQVANQEKELKVKNAKQPVKIFNEQEKTDLASKMGLKKEE